MFASIRLIRNNRMRYLWSYVIRMPTTSYFVFKRLEMIARTIISKKQIKKSDKTQINIDDHIIQNVTEMEFLWCELAKMKKKKSLIKNQFNVRRNINDIQYLETDSRLIIHLYKCVIYRSIH